MILLISVESCIWLVVPELYQHRNHEGADGPPTEALNPVPGRSTFTMTMHHPAIEGDTLNPPRAAHTEHVRYDASGPTLGEDVRRWASGVPATAAMAASLTIGGGPPIGYVCCVSTLCT